jgi:hypothetical protein
LVDAFVSQQWRDVDVRAFRVRRTGLRDPSLRPALAPGCAAGLSVRPVQRRPTFAELALPTEALRGAKQGHLV